MAYKKNNSGFVLIMSIVLMIFLGIMLAASSLRANIELQESMSRLATQQAFYAAESSLQQAVVQLRQGQGYYNDPVNAAKANTYQALINDSNPASNTIVGYNKVQVLPTTNYQQFFPSVWIKSWGQDASQKVTVSILARVVIESPTNFFLSTAGNLQVRSGSSIDYDILGNVVSFVVDPSPTLTTDERKITITDPDQTKPSVYYLQEVQGYTDSSGNPDPAIDITGSPPSPKQSPIESFPGVDLDYYRALAQYNGSYNSDGLTYDGDPSVLKLSKNNNGVVFSEKDIHISGPVPNPMIFVAGGNIYIENSVTVPTSNGLSPQNDPNAPQVGLLAKEDVIIPDTAPYELTIDAFMMADGGPGSQGGILQAPGTKGSKTSINIVGAIALRGSGVTTTAADLNVYKQRIYNYNTNFQTKNQIPYLLSVAKIVNWQEVNPNDQIPANPPQ